MQQRKFLITGATGKTGVHVAGNLLEAGHAVRAMVHREDARSAALRAAGAEVVVGDLLDNAVGPLEHAVLVIERDFNEVLDNKRRQVVLLQMLPIFIQRARTIDDLPVDDLADLIGNAGVVEFDGTAKLIGLANMPRRL